MTDLLEARATRGLPRGADEVFARAISVPPRGGDDRPRRVAAVLAVIVVLALVAAAVLALRADGDTDQGPVDEGPAPEVGGPLFGAETGTALIVAGDYGEGIAVDLDSGIARSLPGVRGADALAVVEDRLVFAGGQGLWSAPLDASASATLLTATPNGREVGANDTYDLVPSGDTGRFWVQSGPIADAPGRSFLAGEHDLSGAVTVDPVDLGRSDRSLWGATSEWVVIGAPGGSAEVFDRDGIEVRELPNLVDAGGDRVVWGEPGERRLHVLDADTGEERTVDLPEGVDPSLGGELSPDGRLLAVAVQTEQGLTIGALDLASGELSAPRGPTVGGEWGRPVWSPDGRWVFAPAALADQAAFVGYRVGDDEATAITIPGLAAWSVVAAPAIPAPEGPVEPCGPVVAGQAACRVTAVASPAPTTTTVPVPVDRPIDPSVITVIVANGSGVSGAAGAVTNELAALGYQVLPPADTDQDVPLDTVYYVAEPDTSAQARRSPRTSGSPRARSCPTPASTAPRRTSAWPRCWSSWAARRASRSRRRSLRKRGRRCGPSPGPGSSTGRR